MLHGPEVGVVSLCACGNGGLWLAKRARAIQLFFERRRPRSTFELRRRIISILCEKNVHAWNKIVIWKYKDMVLRIAKNYR